MALKHCTSNALRGSTIDGCQRSFLSECAKGASRKSAIYDSRTRTHLQMSAQNQRKNDKLSFKASCTSIAMSITLNVSTSSCHVNVYYNDPKTFFNTCIHTDRPKLNTIRKSAVFVKR